MIASNSKISIRQLQVLFILDIFGTGVIILPRICAEFAGNDGWLLIIGGAIFALLYVYIINSLAEKFPRQSFVEYSSAIMGRPLGFALSFLFAGRLIIMAGLELRIFGEIIRQTMLYQTPIELTCGAMVLLATYLALKGYETRARVGEILIFLIFIPLLLTFGVAAVGTDFTNLAPFLKTPTEQLFLGSFYVSLAFRGIELALLVYPMTEKPAQVKKGQSFAVFFMAVIMLLLTVVTIARFGAKDTTFQMWPIIQMMDTIDYPGRFFERQDAIILSFWIISIYVAISAGVFFSSHIFGKIFMAKKANVYILPCAIFIYAVALLPGNIVETYRLINFSDFTLGVGYMVVVPMLLLVVAKLRKVGEGTHEKG